jgi:hypothetical protein
MQRAEELLRQMTIEEKAMQLSCVIPIALIGPDGSMREHLDSLIGQGIGHVAGVGLLGHKSPETSRQDSKRDPALPVDRDPAEDTGDLSQ